MMLLPLVALQKLEMKKQLAGLCEDVKKKLAKHH